MGFRQFGQPFGSAFGRAMGQGSGGSAAPISYTLKDEYLDLLAAGSVNGTLATDGINTRAVTDTANKAAITANGLEITALTTTDDPTIRYNTQVRAFGLAVGFRIKPVSSLRLHTYGFDAAATGLIDDGIGFSVSNLAVFTSTSALVFSVVSLGTVYDFVTIARNPGCWYVMRVGGTSDWIFIVPSVSGSSSPLYPAGGAASTGGGTGASSIMNRRVYRTTLSQWVSQYANATARIATTVANNTIANADGNGVIEHTIVAATGVTQRLFFRYTDDNNCLIVDMNQGAGTILVIEKIAGVETPLVGGTATQTWTNSISYRILVILNGNDIRVFVGIATKNVVTSTGFNATVTGVKVSHAGTDLIAWPRIITGAAKAELDAFFPA